MRCCSILLLPAVLLAGLPAASTAQGSSGAVVEASVGHASFVDDSPIHHFNVGAGLRWPLTRRLTVGPEVVFMRGPGSDRDVFLTGKVMFDFDPGSRASVFLIGDGGLMLHHEKFFRGSAWFKEAAGSFGGGVRIGLTDRLYIAPEVRIGWEPHLRATVLIGWRL